MDNARAAYYEYLALADHERARVFRSFGYHASADYVERRAKRYELEAKRKTGPEDLPPAPSPSPAPTDHPT